jgi:hypothetical protein
MDLQKTIKDLRCSLSANEAVLRTKHPESFAAKKLKEHNLKTQNAIVALEALKESQMANLWALDRSYLKSES